MVVTKKTLSVPTLEIATYSDLLLIVLAILCMLFQKNSKTGSTGQGGEGVEDMQIPGVGILKK